jgi:type VI secretion system protein ImpG
MDPRFIQYYNRELQYIREMGGEFARQFSKIAGRLGMDGFEVADPYVERLLEGFAFLAARVQLKLDDAFPRFTQHLLEMVYPHYLAPTPSMAVVQLSPNPREGALTSGVTVPRNSALRSLLGKEEQTACEYRTAHDVTLWPISIAKAEYRTFLGALDDLPSAELGRASAVMRLTLVTTGGQSFDKLPLDRLPIFLRGDLEVTSRLYEQLHGHAIGMFVRPRKRPGPWQRVPSKRPIRALGFEDHEALLPRSARSFEGYRLLHEYFAFPSRFMFAELCDLRASLAKCPGEEVEVLILFDAADAALEGALDVALLGLFCTPAINLFPRRADRIHLNDTDHEYHVIPDRTRPMDFEVHSVGEVTGFGSGVESKRKFLPFYAYSDGAGDRPAYYTLRREQRRLSERQRAHGPRSSYVGSEVFISLVDGDEGPFASDLKQLGLETMCTNRDLPLHMPLGQGRTDFTLESGAPVASIRSFAGPTVPRASYAHGNTAWRLISHLSLNYLSLTDPGALRELLLLYADLGEGEAKRQIEAVRGVASKPIVRHLTSAGPLAFARGVQVDITCDESAFQGASVFLFGAVLERFFAKYTSINSFTETVLQTVQRGEVMRWPASAGQTRVL